jgi:hypothetical protein
MVHLREYEGNGYIQVSIIAVTLYLLLPTLTPVGLTNDHRRAHRHRPSRIICLRHRSALTLHLLHMGLSAALWLSPAISEPGASGSAPL